MAKDYNVKPRTAFQCMDLYGILGVKNLTISLSKTIGSKVRNKKF